MHEAMNNQGTNRLIMVNDLASNNSTQYEGDTGGQRLVKKSLVYFQANEERKHAGSQETQRLTSPSKDGNTEPIVPVTPSRFGAGH